MAISFVAATGNTADNVAGGSYTLLKPTGAVQGDVIICGVIIGDALVGGAGSATLPTGWTQLGSTLTTAAGNDGIFLAGYRVVGASDPASWTDGGTPSDADVVCTITSCYRGVDTAAPVVGSIGAWGSNPGTQASGNVNNTSADNWAVGIGAYIDESTTTLARSAGDPITQRDSTRQLDGGETAGIALWDSDGVVATGDRSFTSSETGTTDALLAWVVVLNVLVPSVNSLFNIQNQAVWITAF